MRSLLAPLLVLAASACAPTAPAPAPAPSPSTTATAPPASSVAEPTAQSVARATQWGVAAVAPGSGVAGPFLAADGTLMWADDSGRVTMYLPEHPVVVLGQLQGDRAAYRYVLLPQGNYALGADGQATPLAQPTSDMMEWPHLDAVAASMVQVIQAYLAQGGTIPPPDQVPADLMSQLSRQQHETTMNVLNNIGDAGCTERRDAETNAYLGCW